MAMGFYTGGNTNIAARFTSSLSGVLHCCRLSHAANKTDQHENGNVVKRLGASEFDRPTLQTKQHKHSPNTPTTPTGLTYKSPRSLLHIEWSDLADQHQKRRTSQY